MEMVCSCFKEKDALNPPGSVENSNAVECGEHLDFYHILPFHKQEFQAFSTCCIRFGKKKKGRRNRRKSALKQGSLLSSVHIQHGD